MYKALKKNKEIWCYIEDLVLHTRATKVHWQDNKSSIHVVESKRVTPIVFKMDIPIFFIQEHLTMVFLLRTMISLMSYSNICAPNHVQVQLSVGLINRLLDSFSTQPKIQKNINSWYYMSLLKIKQTTGSVLFYLSLSVTHSMYLCFPE